MLRPRGGRDRPVGPQQQAPGCPPLRPCTRAPSGGGALAAGTVWGKQRKLQLANVELRKLPFLG